ncbi:MAG: hypothetical protein ACLUKO_18375 [Enterocloster bolteae]
MVRENKVKQKLKNGEAVIGTFVKTVDPSVIEILGCSGMEFFVIDSEHVSYNPETITDLVRASDLTGIVPIVRVREATAVNIMQALDTGALGYHAPNVDTRSRPGLRWTREDIRLLETGDLRPPTGLPITE